VDRLTENEVRGAEENEQDGGSKNGPILEKMVGNHRCVGEQNLQYNKTNKT
jgi:hypothetical protein